MTLLVCGSLRILASSSCTLSAAPSEGGEDRAEQEQDDDKPGNREHLEVRWKEERRSNQEGGQHDPVQKTAHRRLHTLDRNHRVIQVPMEVQLALLHSL